MYKRLRKWQPYIICPTGFTCYLKYYLNNNAKQCIENKMGIKQYITQVYMRLLIITYIFFNSDSKDIIIRHSVYNELGKLSIERTFQLCQVKDVLLPYHRK